MFLCVCLAAAANARVDDDEFLDMIASIQGSRMDDQRADGVALFPGLHGSPAIIRQFASGAHHAVAATEGTTILDDEQFFDMLMRCQVQLDCFVSDLLVTLAFVSLGWLGGVVVRVSDLRLAVVGSNPGHGIAGFF